MIAVIFEVTVDPEQGGRYFDLAAALGAELDEAEGFLSIERFQSLTTGNKYVSPSFWRDRETVEAWYRRPNHERRPGRRPPGHLPGLPDSRRRGVPRLRHGGRTAADVTSGSDSFALDLGGRLR